MIFRQRKQYDYQKLSKVGAGTALLPGQCPTCGNEPAKQLDQAVPTTGGCPRWLLPEQEGKVL